jgi:hypothetical protein
MSVGKESVYNCRAGMHRPETDVVMYYKKKRETYKDGEREREREG